VKKALGLIGFGFAVYLQPTALILINEWHLQAVFNTPDITFIQAYCIGMMVSLYNYQDMLKVDKKDAVEIIWTLVFRYGVVIAAAWALAQF